MKVKPNLFLNMSPQTTEEGGLAFARNMKLDDDGNLVSDYGYKNISAMANYNIVGHIVGLDNKIYLFCHTLVEGSYVDDIVEYDEVEETSITLDTHWSYNGGEIDGYVNTNQSGEKILTIGEYKDDGNVPLKHINLKFPKIKNSSNVVVSDESIYSQAPKCPTANIVIRDTYVKTIPNGVYVFFIRYKIRKDVYTNWFLASAPIFGGTSEHTITLQGGLKYINLHKDSAKSFVLQINFANTDNLESYEEFQLGFIITHDEATDARAWKHFKRNKFLNSEEPSATENLIYFDYEDVEEINIDDLLETTYELYNVRNITAFKNKLYISNYIESNFNIDLNVGNYFDVNYKAINTVENNVAHNTVILKLLNDYTLSSYDEIYKYYTKANENLTIANAIKQYLDANNIGDLLDINISDFIKGDTTEKENVLKITYFGECAEDPDIIYANILVNDIYDNIIFGANYTKSFNSDGNGWNDIGLIVARTSQTSGIYTVTRYSSRHNWDNSENLYIGFGIFGNDNQYPPSSYSDALKGNISLINNDILNNNLGISGSKFISEAIRSEIANMVKKSIENKSRLILGYAVISSDFEDYVVLLSNNVTKSLFDTENYMGDNNSNNYFDIDNKTNSSNTAIQNKIKSELRNIIYTNTVGVDDSGNIVLSINGNIIKANNITFYFKACELSLDSGTEINTNNDQRYEVTFSATLKSTVYSTLCTFGLKNSKIIITEPIYSDDVYKQTSTLMPLSTYDIYIHLVDNHNIITNGIFLKKLGPVPALTLNQQVAKYILQYSINNVPAEITDKYKSFFISIVNVGDIIVETFDYKVIDGFHIVNVLEADALLYNINDNITIINNSGTVITTKAKYYSSGESIPALAFGNCGFVGWYDEDNPSSSTQNLYVKIARSKSNTENVKVIKATPYIKLRSTQSLSDIKWGYYGSYFCSIKKPSFDLSSLCYVSGNDVYSASRNTVITLKDYKQYLNSQDSTTYFLRSNFNLNYLSLTEDITDKIYSIGTVKQVKKTINSAVLSFIYELKSMYKDFMNKTFKVYDPNYKIDFDNTIRVSHVLSDETFNNSIFKFSAKDYYNIPTDRGIIVNLFTIGNNIFVHTKRAFYKFDGNQTIASNNQDIQLQESEPFDTGISQIFDSEYGYGGIDTKQSGCITFDSYFFYDKSSNHIFAYGGNSQVQLIDGNIYRLLAYYKPKDCKTIHDELNCRVLFEFTSGRPEHNVPGITYKTFTLSYNYKTKTFVSFHDLSLVNAFSGLHRAYSYKSNLTRLFEIETIINTTTLVEGMHVNRIFGDATTACVIEFGSQIYKKQTTPFGIAIVLLSQNNIKEVVDSVKYIADIQQHDPETQSSPIYDVLVNPQVTRTNPVVNFYIVTDSCVSSLVNTNVDDTARPNSLLDYKGFKYDMGFWVSNYFRNDINKTNIYDYPQKYPNRALDADNNSLVYGRYFIFVFDFKANTPIKFEEIFMNTDKY